MCVCVSVCVSVLRVCAGTCTHWLLLSAIRMMQVAVATPCRLVNSPLFLPLLPVSQPIRCQSRPLPVERPRLLWKPHRS